MNGIWKSKIEKGRMGIKSNSLCIMIQLRLPHVLLVLVGIEHEDRTDF